MSQFQHGDLLFSYHGFMADVVISGERLLARPDRTLFWPAHCTLILADIHFGKPESFRKLGIPAVGDTTTSSLVRIDRAIQETESQRLIILGDFWHARDGKTPDVLQAIGDWRVRHRNLPIDLILGNHDRASGGVPTDWQFDIHTEPTRLGPFVLAHEPMAHPDGYTLSGHLHPSIRISGRGKQSVRLPCFWFGERCAVLPAFGGYTGMAEVSPQPRDRVIGIAEGELIEL